MADCHSSIVHGFNDGIVDPKIKIIEDSLFMPSQHPGKVSQGSDPTVSCPPEPAFEILGCSASPFVVLPLDGSGIPSGNVQRIPLILEVAG